MATMREYRLALATASATFVLLMIGGVVHATGSSLACPDWPLCYGQVFPAMTGGVLFEHGHRLAAATVALLTASLAVLVFLRRRDRTLRALAALAVALVLVQAALGGITVVYKLPLLVSTGHLATSMAFFSTVIYLAHRLRPAERPPAAAGPRWLVGAAALATYAQLVLGAFVRHTGSGLACNTRLPLCDGVLWPSFGPAQLHMAHRVAGVALAVIVLAACVRPAREALRDGATARAALALAAPALAAIQIALGLLTVATYVSVPIVTLHLAVGALLLADLLALFLSLGGRTAWEGAAESAALASAAG
jgi:heme A synthase